MTVCILYYLSIWGNSAAAINNALGIVKIATLMVSLSLFWFSQVEVTNETLIGVNAIG